MNLEVVKFLGWMISWGKKTLGVLRFWKYYID